MNLWTRNLENDDVDLVARLLDRPPNTIWAKWLGWVVALLLLLWPALSTISTKTGYIPGMYGSRLDVTGNNAVLLSCALICLLHFFDPQYFWGNSRRMLPFRKSVRFSRFWRLRRLVSASCAWVTEDGWLNRGDTRMNRQLQWIGPLWLAANPNARHRKATQMKLLHLLLLAPVVTILCGCSTTHYAASARGMSTAPAAELLDPNRMLIWRAWLSLEVANVSNAWAQVGEIAKKSGGYVESKSDSGDTEAEITIRVPAASLHATMASLESIGKVVRRRVSSEDVTEQYMDIDARLKNLVALRDRLRALLDKAQDVKDVLAIEKELSRVQGELDSMQARLNTLKGKVDLASIEVKIERRRILGPIGYLLKGAWWVVEKLFVIQD